MAHTVESRISTPAAELRELLDKAERQLPVLAATELEGYLLRLDRIEALFVELQANHAAHGADTDQMLRAESVRWVDLQEQLRLRSARLVQLAASSGGFAALRARHATATGDWWRLDELVAARRRRQLRQLLQTLAVAGVLLLAAGWAYQTWLAPDPATITLVNALSAIEQRVDEREWDAALAIADETIRTTPPSAEVLMWAAVLSERLGDNARAARYQEQATEQLGGDAVQTQLVLGMNRYRAGDLDGATTAADAVLALQPDEPQAYFLRGNIAEARGDLQAAMAAFDRAAQLAESSNPQLTVISKMRYGFLLQQIQVVPDPGQTPAAEDAPEEPAAVTPTP